VKLARNSGLALLVALILAAPAGAHQPVNLSAAHSKIASSPIMVDGTISFAVYAAMTTSSPTRSFRFFLSKGETLGLEYLILDQRPENALSTAQLPVVTYTSPGGRTTTMKINERTAFYEPFGRKKYLYLSRVSAVGEEGIYTVTIRAKRSSSVVIAVGTKEIRGIVLDVGNSQGQCPLPLGRGMEIAQSAADQLLGMSERSSQACAAANKWGYRVISRDGEDFPVTLDYRMDRINVTVVADKVTAVSIG